MISIDTVYKTVQSLLKKNQQGYITPGEFNNYAKLANLSRFNELYGRPETYQNGRPKIAYAETQLIDEKLSPFIQTSILPVAAITGYVSKPNTLLRMDAMKYNRTVGGVKKVKKVRRVNKDKEAAFIDSKVMPPTEDYPIYVDYGTYYQIYPITLNEVELVFLGKPVSPLWAYTITGGRPIYDSVSSVNFEWDESEFGNIVSKILELAGVSVSDNNAVNFGAQQEIKGQ